MPRRYPPCLPRGSPALPFAANLASVDDTMDTSGHDLAQFTRLCQFINTCLMASVVWGTSIEECGCFPHRGQSGIRRLRMFRLFPRPENRIFTRSRRLEALRVVPTRPTPG